MLLEILNTIDSFIWGLPLIVLLVGTGIWLTVRLKLIQVFRLFLAMKLIVSSENKGNGDVNAFKVLCIALAATVGTGNIVGVATAVKTGGPGALFWMWIAAFFGMATKYAECMLAVKYREIDSNGNISGGPMYYIKNGMGEKWKWLATMFAIFGMLSGILGIGTMTQVNTIADIVNIGMGFDPMFVNFVVTFCAGIIIFGGIRFISNAASMIVPFMAIAYFISTVVLLLINADKVPAAFASIISDAFTGTAMTGGFLGSSVMLAMRSGIARGIFSNESGLGSAPIVAAAAKTNYPAEQGLVSMTGTFFDTIIICTLTGLSLVVTDVWSGSLKGVGMTNSAFLSVYPDWGTYILMISLSLFAFSSIIGWSYYSERCAVYLFGTKSIFYFRLAWVSAVGFAAFLQLEEIWCLADICNGLMAFPNLVGVLSLSPVVIKETKEYFKYLENCEK